MAMWRRIDRGMTARAGSSDTPPPSPARRRLVLAAGAAAVGVPLSVLSEAARGKTAPPDPTKVTGMPVAANDGYGHPSPFETARRVAAPNPSPLTSWSLTPLADLVGNITPSGLHYERHHAGVPTIDPLRHMLTVHGMVTTPKRFTMDDIKRMPVVTRKHFIECSGNTASEWKKPTAKTVQSSHGLLSTSEWTGVSFATLARETGIAEGARWVLAEGSDAALMTRSIPIDKMLDDAMLAFGQNGEALRPEQGYPLRLLLPGYEGNTHIKWLRRIEISDRPFMTREETSKYTDLKGDGIADQFVFVMEAKSVITAPSGGMRIAQHLPTDITGYAWSGRGRIQSVEVSVDGGSTWYPAQLADTPLPKCTVRFHFPWRWDGRPARLVSRCTDETGYVQPTNEALVALRGLNYHYHYNGLQSWDVASNGEVGVASLS